MFGDNFGSSQKFYSPVIVPLTSLNTSTHVCSSATSTIFGFANELSMFGNLLGSSSNVSETYPPKQNSGIKAKKLTASKDALFMLAEDGTLYGIGHGTKGIMARKDEANVEKWTEIALNVVDVQCGAYNLFVFKHWVNNMVLLTC